MRLRKKITSLVAVLALAAAFGTAEASAKGGGTAGAGNAGADNGGLVRPNGATWN